MASYNNKFDAKTYWSRKPLCSICGTRKVKNGTVCYKCKEKVMEENTLLENDPEKINAVVKATDTQQEPDETKKISQIKFDKGFIKRLLEKLKTGNARSIHLNAIPGRSATRLDVCQLSDVSEELPHEFLHTLISKEDFSFQISFDKVELGKIDEEHKKRLSLLAKRLNTMVIEKEDNYLEYGLENFGFGYPLLVKRDQNDPTKIIKAPIFIWHLDIERSYQNKNNWTIKKEEDSPIQINELLISHLSKDEAIKIERISKEVLEDGVLDSEELINQAKIILAQLDAKVDDLEVKLEKCPDAKTIESISNSKPWIQWSGIFGIYRSQNETIIHATEELLDRFEEFESEDLVLEQFQTSSISAVETDPSQEEIVNTLTKDEIKLIQGPPGTGKSQSITAIISNALANGAKCLIVCEKKTALDVIYSNLERKGLADFAVVIDDVNKDRKKVIQKARDIKDSPYYPSFSTKDFEVKYEKFNDLKEEINSKHAEALKNVFGDYTWKRLIGLYLKYSKSGDLQTILENVEFSGLEFEHEEYVNLLSVVEEGGFLYGDLQKDSDKIFSPINSSLFVDRYTWQTQEKVAKACDEILERLERSKDIVRLEQSDCCLKDLSIFSPDSLDKCSQFLNSSINALVEIDRNYKQGIELIGNKFNQIGFSLNMGLQISSLFNKNNKEVLSLRKKISALLYQLFPDVSEINNFGFNIETTKPKEFKSYEEINNFSVKLLRNIETIKDFVDKAKKIKSQLFTLEKDLAKIESTGVINLQVKTHEELNSQKAVVEYYENLKNGIAGLSKNLSGYESYHNWSYFYQAKDKFEQKLVKSLRNYPAEDWKCIFMAWYYKGALINYESTSKTGFHKSDSKLQQFVSLYDDLSDSQTKQIKSSWGSKRNYQVSATPFNFNTLYNLRKNNAGPKNSLRKIIARDFNLFTTLFPVVLTNPVAANAILPLELGIFNLVIFDEASQLKIADTFTSLIRGQYKIVAGDEHQMPPSSYFESTAQYIDDPEDDEDTPVDDNAEEQQELAESESLLKFASDLKVINKSYLDFHYRSNHPALIEFSNCAFYGGNLVPFPENEVYTPIEFRHVNGRYETRTNGKEIIEILKILSQEIHPDQKGKYPSVGIATFNINQRNLITEALNEAADQDAAFRHKLQELREKGLFVKNLENIQGDERDIIIISTTYGIQPDGRFSQNFARLNRIEGYKLLNVLITRAKHKLYVCTSIPKEKYVGFADIIQEEGNNKRGILYAYLAYAEAISSNNSELASSILNILKQQSFERPRVFQDDGLSESPFEEEVYELLLEHFDKSQIVQQHKVGGFRLDFVIKTETKNIALECDGKAYHQSEEAYAHDMYRQKELEKMGFVVYRIWSTNWFQDKEVEMQKLLKFIDSQKI